MTSQESFGSKVLAVSHALEDCEIPYAMGGAISYVYYAEPRTTSDIDINVFISESRAADVLACLGAIGIRASASDLARLQRDAQVRLALDGTFVDLFFPVHEFHASCASRIRRVPFNGRSIPILSAEDLVVFKALFNRSKDWLDIEQILQTQGPDFDGGYALRWLDEMVGPEDASRIRVATLIDERRR